MQPMFAIHSSASSSFTTAYSMMRLLAVARRGRERRALDPVGHVRRRVLLEEALALPAVGIALHRERPPAQVRDENLRDVAVVRDQVAFRDPLLGPERLVEVGEAQLSAAPLHDGGSGARSRRTSERRLVLLQAQVRRRAQPALVRPLRELDLRDELRLDPRDVGPTHARHLRNLGERRIRALERSEQSQQPLDLAVREARPDVSRPPQHTRVVYPDDERAEPSRASSLPARVPGDDDLLRLAQLELVPVRRATPRLVRGSRSCLATTPSSSWSRAAASRAAPSSNCGETKTSSAAADDSLELLSAFAQRLVDDGGSSRPRAGRRERARRFHRPPGGARSVSGPRSSRTQISPSSTASGVRDRVRRSASDIAEALRQVVAVSARERDLAARDRHDRAEAVPLRLEHPALARRKRLRGGGEHRLVATARCAVVGVLPQEQPVLRIAVEVTPERASRRRRGALRESRTVEPAVALLLEEVVRAAIPDLDGSRAVLSGRDRSRRSRRIRAGDPRRAPRDGARPCAAGLPSAPPSSRERRLARAGSRSGADARRAAGSRSAAGRPASSPLPKGSGVFPDAAYADTRRGSPVDCRPKRNAFFTNWLQDRAFSLLRPHNEAGDKPVEGGENAEFGLGRRRGRPSRGTSRAAAVAAPSGSSDSISSNAARMPCSSSTAAPSGSAWAPPSGSATIPSATPSSTQCSRIRLERRSGLPRLARVAPEDRGAPLR